jgi:CMP-N,N'-diacetyllegionaminic acid synthase
MTIDDKIFLVIIPARKGSKGIPGKNLKKIGGKPMIQFTIEAALSCVHPKNILVTSDDDNVIKLSKSLGLKVPFKRPKNLSTDSANTSDVILHSLDWYQSKYNKLPTNILLLQPTSPFRSADNISLAIKKFVQSGKKTLISVSVPTQHPGDCILKDQNGKFKRLEIAKDTHGRQSYPEVFFIDGGIYISETSYFLETQDLIGDNPEIFLTEQFNAIDIDTPFDLDCARALYDLRLPYDP